MKKYIALMFLIFFASKYTIAAGDGGYAGAFLRMGLSARAKAMGDAFTALPMGAVSAVYNPALIAHLPHRSALISLSALPLDRKLDFIGYAQPISQKASENEKDAKPFNAGIALGWVHAGVDNIEGRDFSGNYTQDYSYSENAFYLSFAIAPIEILSFGLNGKILYNRFPKLKQDEKALTSSGFGVDLGIVFRPFYTLILGLALRDKLAKNTWNTDKVWDRGTSTTDKYPDVTRFGVCYQPFDYLIVVADMENSKVQNPRYHLGVEGLLRDYGSLRLGLDDGAFTTGFAVIVPGTNGMLNLGYAFYDEISGAGYAHIFDFSFSMPYGKE